MKMITWKYKPSGYCPVQSEGYFLGSYFYFRSRHSAVTIDFANSEKDWEDDKIIISFLLMKKPLYRTGWLDHNKCKFLIYKGCLKFYLHKKFKKWFHSK